MSALPNCRCGKEAAIIDTEPAPGAVGYLVACANPKCRMQTGTFPTPAMARSAWAQVMAPEEWQPIATAPRNGTMLLLMVDYSGPASCALEDEIIGRTVGWNNFDNDGENEWKFAGWNWANDYFTSGDENGGKAIYWMPYPAAKAEKRS